MNVTWELFFQILAAGKMIDETYFYFSDDPQETEHYLGYLPEYENPYWVGYCDIENGCNFKTAEELVNAPIYDGRSLKERWNEVVLCAIGNINVDEWFECVSFP